MKGSKTLTQPLKWHGGKHYLAKKIISLMPPHLHYVEPFFGGGSVLLQKSYANVSEVANDVHRELTNFWRVLQAEESFLCFQRVVQAIPFSQVEWNEANEKLDQLDQELDPEQVPAGDEIDRAVRFFVRCRLSRAGKMDSFATMSRNRTRRGMNEQAASWLSAVEGLEAVSARLRRVVIFCGSAERIIASQDGDNTLFYLDPPYLHDTRVTTADYDYEMTSAQHESLLAVLVRCQGKVILSGYPSETYGRWLKDWNVVDIPIDNKASSAKQKPRMIERIWMNY